MTHCDPLLSSPLQERIKAATVFMKPVNNGIIRDFRGIHDKAQVVCAWPHPHDTAATVQLFCF